MFNPGENITLIQAELAKLGYSAKSLVIDSIPHVMFEKANALNWLTPVTPALSYPMTHAAIRQISRNKSMANDFVDQLGYRIPQSMIYADDDDMAEATKLLKTVGRIVVKPEYGSLSRGVSLGIATQPDVVRAIKIARQGGSGRVVIQEQVHGDEVRFVIINGQMKAAILRQTPRVIGDGTTSIRTLIKIENIARQKITNTLVPYPVLDETNSYPELLSSKEIPGKGEVIELGHGTMIRSGASIYDITDKLHASYKTVVESIALSLGARFIIIDMFLADYTEALGTNYWFIEFNTSPVLKLFYSCRDGKHFDAAKYLAEAIDGGLART